MKNLIQIYETSNDKEEKNNLLRIALEKVIVKMTAKRKGPVPAQFEITPILRFGLLTGDTLTDTKESSFS